MRTVSQGFIDASVSPIGYASAYITIGSTTIDASNIIDITITEDIGSSFTIGTFGTTEAIMTVVSDALPNVVTAQPINIYFGYYVDNGTTASFEYVPMGVFYAEPRDVSHKNLMTTIKAHDRSWAMTDAYTTSLDFTGNVKVSNVLSEIQTALSLTMGVYGGLNPSNVRVYEAPQGSYRDVIAQMAMLMGTNAKLNRTGALDFIKVSNSTAVQSYGAYDYASENYELTSDEQAVYGVLTTKYTHTVTTGSGEEQETEEVTDTYTYSAPIGSHGIVLDTVNIRSQAECNALGGAVIGNGFSYYGYTATLPGQPQIDLGDVINITEPLGDNHDLIVLSATHQFNGALKSTFGAVINDSDPEMSGGNIAGSLTEQVSVVQNALGRQTRLLADTIAANQAEFNELSANIASVGTLVADKADVNAANILSLSAKEAWVDKLMVSTGLLANSGTVYTLDAIQVNAANITAGTIDVQRLIVTVDGQKYMVQFDAQGTPSYQKLDGNIIEPRTITADKIVANSITTSEITTQNLVGTNGWINLAQGKFFYGNGSTWAASTAGISWDGTSLLIKGNVNITGGNVYTKTEADGKVATAKSEAISTASADATSKANAAENNAKQVATNFLSFSSSNGVDVGYTVSGSALSSKVNIKGDGIRLFDGEGNNCAFFGVDSNNPSVRIGKTDQRGHMRITPGSGVRFLREDDSTPMAQLASDGLQIWSNDGTTNTSSAFFGAECRVGPIASKNIYVGNGAINFRDNGTSLGEFTGTTARIGKADSSHVEIGATNGMNIFDENNKLRLNASSTGISIFDFDSGGNRLNVAQFNNSVRIGPVADGQSRVFIQPSGIDFIRRVGEIDNNLAHIGYDTANAQSGTATLPFYTFGSRYTVDPRPVGGYSFYAGQGGWASGWCSFASGKSRATGFLSHAVINSIAEGDNSYAEGEGSQASGNYSHAQNWNTKANGASQTAIGKYNIADTTSAFIIGNGSSSARSNALTVDWSGNVNIASGAHYKINGTNLSASDVGAVPTTRTVNGKALSSNITLTNTDVGAVRNSYGSLTNVFPQGFTNADSIKVGITGSIKATPTATEDTQYLFGARAIAPVLYNDTTGTTIWTGYTTLNKPSASDVGALPIGGGTLTGDLTVNGKIQGLYRITSTTVATDSIGANSAKAASNYPITSYSTYINAGYEPVAISGDATDNSAIKATARIYDDSGTKKIRATFRNNSSSAVSTNYYFYILWLKATSA